MLQSSDKPLEEKEYPDEADLADEEDESSLELVPCPNCGELLWEEAQQCPHCKEWISAGISSLRSSRKWYVRGGLYLTRTLLLNWLFWLALGAAGAVVVILESYR